MRYKLTNETLPRVNELSLLIAKTRASLGGLSAEARRDWDRLRQRFPSNDDLYQGFISLSEGELGELHASLLRFRETIAEARPVSLHTRASRTFEVSIQSAA